MKSAVITFATLLLAFNASACISSGTESAIQAALDGGVDAVLCASSTFSLYAPLQYRYANTQIYTEGSPTGATRATLRISSSSVQTAVEARDMSGVQLRSVIVDGARPTYGYVRPTSYALIDFGGDASNQVVSYVEAYEPRGWSTLYVNEGNKSWNGSAWVGGCSGAQVTHNTVHNAGNITGQKWADGISYACHDGYVGYNNVTDATDGGLIVFGAPNTIFEYNTISNINVTGFGGIGFDGIPYNRTVTISGVPTLVNDFSGTIVRYNTVDTGSIIGSAARTQIGMALGPRVWWSSCAFPTNEAKVAYGATVTNNTLSGWNFGYGYAIDGVDSLTASGNTVAANGNTQWFGGGIDCSIYNKVPAMFNVHSAHATNSSIQSTFTWTSWGEIAVSEGQVHHVPSETATR